MSNTFLISDTHFSHANICRFLREDGGPLRPWDDIEAMDEAMVANWNSVVGTNDTVYHLGDVVMSRRFLPIIDRLNGSKRLILGNHDIFDYTDYAKYFKRLHGSHKLDNLLLTHIPVHLDSVPKWALANVHGHIHAQDVKHPLFYNVSVENINYTPISLEDLRQKILDKKIEYQVDTVQ